MKRIGFITDDIDIQEPISKILDKFNKQEKIHVETINRLNPELPTINKIQSLFDMCDVIVFYISRGNPNIYFEIGLAQGAKKEVIIISQSHSLIPFDLSHQKCIVADSGNFEHIAYEVFRAVEQSSGTKNSYKSKTTTFNMLDSYFNNYSPDVKYRDLYAFNGPKRHNLFERWFYGLAKNIIQWQVMESEKVKSRDSFDFMIWNSSDDPELQSLGNPIPVELKALNSMNTQQWNYLAEKIKRQGLRSLLLLTTAKNRKNSTTFARKLKNDYGIILISLDRDDLIDIDNPKDLYLSIKRQLLNIVYGGD
ncbi:hypothetical protein ABS432_001465 [Salmonella enterica subsp. enterica]|uniref:hypothetical protein n=1 Tax=Enterobacteriaceae TaxID=543 RepID=UPI00080736AD|nr:MULTISPECIES: hypothetical protein [Enterobacteriaceae]EAO1505959.1 hypothetical protein [Salmonella enterica subsp. enterica serovar Bere]ECF6837242.1 hypothetical protein [Salmonella enterica subsp. enterica]EEJ2509139.1 hypothetical protein [Salmonella enterica subsp. arizonae serovar 47:z4,z23:-]EHJ5080385.1 hypothetical protein [Salmonella enterica subsp. enterica serovar 47:z4,z23:-]HEA3397239.1 hypothetical protein [Escherichia coli]